MDWEVKVLDWEVGVLKELLLLLLLLKESEGLLGLEEIVGVLEAKIGIKKR